MAFITLYRGLRNKNEMERLCAYKTAGGKERASTAPTAPTEEEIKNYKEKGTAGECFPPKPDKVILTAFTEYTFCENIARQFGSRSGYMAVIEVDEQYVRAFKNDTLEHGVLIRSDTPLHSVEIYNV